MRVTEAKLKNIIKESVHNLICEWENNANDFELGPNFYNLVPKLKNMAWQVEGFTKEFPAFIQTMQECAEQTGLEFNNAMTDSDFDLDDIATGRHPSFEYEYIMPAIDAQTLSDDQYEALQDKLSEIEDVFNDAFDEAGFRFGETEVSLGENGIYVKFEFSFSE